MQTKRIIPLLLIILTTAAVSFGEVIGKGPKAALNFADFRGEVEYNETMITFGFGSFFGYALNEFFALQPELYFFGKGYRTDGSIGDLELNWDNHFYYFELPLLMKLLLSRSDYLPNLYAGPTVGYLLTAKYDQAEVRDNYKDWDYGVVFGAGAQYPVYKGAVTFDLRYSYGLQNINDLPPPFDKEEVKTSVLSIIVGYSVGK